MKKKYVKGQALARFFKRIAASSLMAAAIGGANSLQAQLLPELIFKDTFNVTETTSDLSFENATRQSGRAAPLTYTRAGGEAQVVLNPDAAPAQITISNAYISPNHNFKEGGQFSIEFDVNPGIDDDPSDGFSGDWCAVVFGASTQNPFVNASDGFGILFRNDGRIEVWDGGAVSYSGIGDPISLPTETAFHVKIDVTTADFKGGSPATIRMSINGTQVRLANDTLERVKVAGFRNNFVTFEGLGNWVHAFDNISISSIPCASVSPTFVDKLAGQTSDAITVTIPAQLNTGKEAALVVTSSDPSVAAPTGADSTGKLTLTYPANGAVTKTFTVAAAKAGTAVLQITGPGGLCVSDVVKVNVASGTGISEVVFNDNFNTTEPSFDVNFENDPRQTGTAGTLNYTESVATAAGGAADEFTAVNSGETAGKLSIMNQGAVFRLITTSLKGQSSRLNSKCIPALNCPTGVLTIGPRLFSAQPPGTGS